MPSTSWRWARMKKIKTGTSDRIDMAKSGPYDVPPIESTKARSPSGTVHRLMLFR